MADESGAEGTVSIVGVNELDPARGAVSWILPIATALLKAQVGRACYAALHLRDVARTYASEVRTSTACRSRSASGSTPARS